MELELRALVVIYYALLFYWTSNFEWVWWLLVASFTLWLWSIVLEDGDPAAEAPVNHERLDAAGTERAQQAEATIPSQHFASHSSYDSEEETESSDRLGETVGSLPDAPQTPDEGDSSQETGDGALGRSCIWEHVIGDGVGAETSNRIDQQVAHVETQTVAVENPDRCGGHRAFSDLEKDHHEPEPLHAPLNTAQSIPRIPEPRNGVQLRHELGGSQLADVVRAADPQSGIQQLPMDHNAGPSAQLLGGSTESEDGSSDERSESDGSPLESPVGRRWSRPFVLHWN